MTKEIWKCKKCGSIEKSSHKDICHTCYMREWASRNPDKVNYIVKNYRKRNPEKKRVWDEAERNIDLKGFCEVCKIRKAEDRHHPDYSKPLKVVLVCKKCHKNIHSHSPLRKPKLDLVTPLDEDTHNPQEKITRTSAHDGLATNSEDTHVKKYTKKYSKRNGIHQVGLKEDKQ